MSGIADGGITTSVGDDRPRGKRAQTPAATAYSMMPSPPPSYAGATAARTLAMEDDEDEDDARKQPASR